ncbi:MAG: hypothetical protein RL417_2232 [Pseudomonadota bacterium]
MLFFSELQKVDLFRLPVLRRFSGARSFSFVRTPVLVRGRVLTSELVSSGAYPARCELSTVRPAVNSRVTISTVEGKKIAVVRTDERGIFRLTLRPGTYVATATELEVSRRITVERLGNLSFDLVRIV